ncbi:MAG: AI-2E family transporter [Tahibacter sp.]
MNGIRWWQPISSRWTGVAPIDEGIEEKANLEKATLLASRSGHLASLRMALLWVSLIATLAFLYWAKPFVVPILFATCIALSLNPLVSGLSRRWFPRALVAALVMIAGMCLLALLVAWVAEPAQHWFERAPDAVRALAPKMRAMTQQLEAAGRTTQSIISLGTQTPPATRALGAPSVPALFNVWEMVSATPRVLGSLFAVVLLVYFFLVYGDSLLRKVVDLSPSLAHKKNTVAIVRATQHEISGYMLTTTLINVCVGIGAGCIALYTGIEDPILWAVLAAVLNFIPYVGPLLMTAMMGLLGLIAFQTVGHALVPAGLFATLVILEGQFLTPLIVGHRMQLDPVVILIWLMLLGWLWGPVGIVIAVPTLVVLKVICQRVEGWAWFARMVG